MRILHRQDHSLEKTFLVKKLGPFSKPYLHHLPIFVQKMQIYRIISRLENLSFMIYKHHSKFLSSKHYIFKLPLQKNLLLLTFDLIVLPTDLLPPSFPVLFDCITFPFSSCSCKLDVQATMLTSFLNFYSMRNSTDWNDAFDFFLADTNNNRHILEYTSSWVSSGFSIAI